jgi:hypothetical protein
VAKIITTSANIEAATTGILKAHNEILARVEIYLRRI